MDELKAFIAADPTKYLYHGTSVGNIAIFEPRQATNNGKPDGDPAVFATPWINVALFAALIKGRGERQAIDQNEDNDGTSAFSFYASRDTLKNANKNSNLGYLYVFNRSDFTQGRGDDFVCFHAISPLRQFVVRRSDFTQPIADISQFIARD